MNLTVRPILFTEFTDEWLHVFQALGLSVVSQSPGWTLCAAREGRVALHGTLGGRRPEGVVGFGLEVPDVAEYFTQLQAQTDLQAKDSFRAEVVEANQGTTVKVDTFDEQSFFIDASAGDTTNPECQLVVEPLWITPDPIRAAEDLTALGLTRTMTNRDERVAYLKATHGQVLTHIADFGFTGTLLAFECVGDLELVARSLTTHNIEFDRIEETHGATLKVKVPGQVDPMWISKLDPDPVGVEVHQDGA